MKLYGDWEVPHINIHVLYTPTRGLELAICYQIYYAPNASRNWRCDIREGYNVYYEYHNSIEECKLAVELRLQQLGYVYMTDKIKRALVML